MTGAGAEIASILPRPSYLFPVAGAVTTFSKLGPYEIVEQLGAGGMGVVYRARDTRLERDVALKVLPSGVIEDEGSQARFRREALALAKLSHPHIAKLFDVGEEHGVSFLVMECVPGQSLATLIASGPLPIREVVALGVEIAGALAEAHEHGVVHRDLKPANVMVTPKQRAMVLDFGLAKLLRRYGDADAPRSVTETNGVVGTLLYMSPEQATGEALDERTDLWSLGVVLYEALTGAPPFRGASALGILNAIAQSNPESVRARRADMPRELDRIIERALAKEPADRYQSAREMERDLSLLLGQLNQAAMIVKERPPRWRMRAAVVLVALVSILTTFAYARAERRHWAIEKAPPAVVRLQASDRPLAAFDVLGKALAYAPDDSVLTRLERQSAETVSVESSPSGATVEVQDYIESDTNAWQRLGVTPIHDVIVPTQWMRWRVTAPNGASVVAAPAVTPHMRFALDSARSAPAGMVYVPGRKWGDYIAFVGWVGSFDLPSFYMDRFEVTNLEYQRFVDGGGYSRRDLWPARFFDGAKELSWEDAMARLRDSTGRPGPSTWKGGHYPDGRGNYPVGGVSWYEAAAYAAWAGKTLPSMAQWYYTAPTDIEAAMVQVSNISRDHVAPVGSFQGVGPFGTYDMAGNVREWASNAAGPDRHLILGRSWASPTYLASEPEALPPFDRSPENGFRCVRDLAAPPPASLAAITPLERDFSKVTPASDEVFRTYRMLYAYDRRPLEASAPVVLHDGSDWREERVTFAPAYGDERLAAYLFLPPHVRPPYQAVVFFPSARVLDLSDSRTLGDVSFFDYVVQSGRAVIYPVYQGTYERRARMDLPGASREMALTVEDYQDAARALDYLGTRADIDTTKVAYLGVSWGAADGIIYSTLLQDRVKTTVLLDGGFFLNKPLPGRDQADFAPRLRIPVLMVNGRYDYSFSLDRAQNPLFSMLGTPAADKRHVILDTPHDVRAKRPELIGAVLPWLDKYLGPVR